MGCEKEAKAGWSGLVATVVPAAKAVLNALTEMAALDEMFASVAMLAKVQDLVMRCVKILIWAHCSAAALCVALGLL